MAEKDLKGGTNPERGWGMMFQNFLDSEFQVVNYAQNGRSTKSFIDQGYWDKVMANLQEGDWVFIEFGHNDSKEKDPARYCAPFGAYQDNLRRFIADSEDFSEENLEKYGITKRFGNNGTKEECLSEITEYILSLI